MKKMILTVLAIAGVVAMQAQEPGWEGRGKFRGPGKKFLPRQMMAEQLNFSDEQKQQAKMLHENFRKSMTELQKKDNLTVKEWRTQWDELRKSHRENLQKLLTQEQKQKIEKMKEDRKKMAEINANARMEKMKLHLGLNNEQVNKWNQLRKENHAKMKALHENKNMDAWQKREALKKLAQNRKESLKSILTDEQLQKLKEMRKRGPRISGKLS